MEGTRTKPESGPLARRFGRFCAVGASGVAVNVGTLALLADGLGVHAYVAAALSIELSILSNFALNDAWTFADRRAAAGSWRVRVVRWHAVSLTGAVVQWCTFVAASEVLALALGRVDPRPVLAAVRDPAPLGGWRTFALLVGIAVATTWNFGCNLRWTWAARHAAAETPSESRP